MTAPKFGAGPRWSERRGRMLRPATTGVLRLSFAATRALTSPSPDEVQRLWSRALARRRVWLARGRGLGCPETVLATRQRDLLQRTPLDSRARRVVDQLLGDPGRRRN